MNATYLLFIAAMTAMGWVPGITEMDGEIGILLLPVREDQRALFVTCGALQ